MSSSKWGGLCTTTNSHDTKAGESSNTTSCPIYTSPSGVSLGVTGTMSNQEGNLGGTGGLSLKIPFP